MKTKIKVSKFEGYKLRRKAFALRAFAVAWLAMSMSLYLVNKEWRTLLLAFSMGFVVWFPAHLLAAMYDVKANKAFLARDLDRG